MLLNEINTEIDNFATLYLRLPEEKQVWINGLIIGLLTIEDEKENKTKVTGK